MGLRRSFHPEVSLWCLKEDVCENKVRDSERVIQTLIFWGASYVSSVQALSQLVVGIYEPLWYPFCDFTGLIPYSSCVYSHTHCEFMCVVSHRVWQTLFHYRLPLPLTHNFPSHFCKYPWALWREGLYIPIRDRHHNLQLST